VRCPEQATIKMPPKEEIQWDPRAEVWEGLPQRDSLLNKVFAKLRAPWPGLFSLRIVVRGRKI
jgi:hypothetical protein